MHAATAAGFMRSASGTNSVCASFSASWKAIGMTSKVDFSASTSVGRYIWMAIRSPLNQAPGEPECLKESGVVRERRGPAVRIQEVRADPIVFNASTPQVEGEREIHLFSSRPHGPSRDQAFPIDESAIEPHPR